MNAEDIIELIEYFRNLDNNELQIQLEELKEYFDVNLALTQQRIIDEIFEYIDTKFKSNLPF